MHLGCDGRFAGILAVTDPIKHSTPDAIQTLHSSGLRIVMATGDLASPPPRLSVQS
jgi:Cu+-exporting ATPase